jgi:hypothetical protein
MTDIRELLREATDDLALEHADPVSRVRRATTRHRRTTAAIGCIVIAVVVAIVLPLAVVNGRTAGPRPIASTPTPAPHARSVLQTWAPDDGLATVGFGSVWATPCCHDSTKPSWVDQLDPATGRRIARISVPGPITMIAAGAGRIWAIGETSGDAATISAIDPTTQQVATLRASASRSPIAGIAFAANSAWVTLPLRAQVWRLTPPPERSVETAITKGVVTVTDAPSSIATTGSGELWVGRGENSSDELTRIMPAAASGHLGQTAQWPGNILGSSGGVTLWVSSGPQRATQLNPAQRSRCPKCLARGNGIKAAGEITAVLQSSRGLFVVADNLVDFYSFRAVESDAASPSSSITVDQAGSIATDGPGVVIGTSSSGLVHWIPAS